MELWSAISLRNPWWLLLALQPFVLWLLILVRRRWQADAFADASLLPWVLAPRRAGGRVAWLRQLALWLAWLCLALAMAGPRQLQRIAGEDTSHYLKLQVVVDESYSMSARDILPSRLQRAVLELHDLIDRLHQVRMGIIVYADRAHVMIPPTTDKSILRQSIDALRVRQLPTEGSGLFDALQLAGQQFLANSQAPGAILLVSDGGVIHDDTDSRARLNRLVSHLRARHIQLYALGVGTAQGAPLLNDQNGWLQHDGRTVVTRLAATRLQRLAQLGNGVYARVAQDDSDWQALYDNGIARLARAASRDSDQGQPVWRDLSPWFVFPGFILLFIAYARRPSSHSVVPVCCLVILLAGGLTHAPPGQAATADAGQAWQQYRAGHYAQAAREFARLPGYVARMAEAASWYQTKQYPRAATAYIRAVLDADTDRQRARALFNLGNCYYRQAHYSRAARTYRDALRYRPDFPAAKTNLAYAQAMVEKARAVPPVGGRAGTGYHTAPAQPNTDVGKGRVSLDESDKSGRLTLPPVDNSNEASATHLLQQAKPATNKVQLDKDKQWTYDITRARDITPQDTRFPVDLSVFWQRLYEAEEGFPAPLARPKVLPGVPPW